MDNTNNNKKIKKVNYFWFLYLGVLLISFGTFFATYFITINRNPTTFIDMSSGIGFLVLFEFFIMYYVHTIELSSVQMQKTILICSCVLAIIMSILGGYVTAKTVFFDHNKPVAIASEVQDTQPNIVSQR